MNYSEKMFVRSLTFCAKTSFEKNAWTFFLLFSWLISDISVKYDCTTYQLKFHLDPGRWFLTQYSTNYPAETRRKHTVSGRNLPENARNSTEKSGDLIRLAVLPGSCLFRAEPEKSDHRICSPEYCFHVPSISDVFQRDPARTSRPGEAHRVAF